VRVFNFYAWSNFQFNGQDVLVGLFVLLCILVYGFLRASVKGETNPLYKYYFKGLLAKMLGSLIFALVYALYYRDGGDTVAYWWGAESLKNVFYHDYSVYFAISQQYKLMILLNTAGKASNDFLKKC
jgi:hypothetical protein